MKILLIIMCCVFLVGCTTELQEIQPVSQPDQTESCITDEAFWMYWEQPIVIKWQDAVAQGWSEWFLITPEGIFLKLEGRGGHPRVLEANIPQESIGKLQNQIRNFDWESYETLDSNTDAHKRYIIAENVNISTARSYDIPIFLQEIVDKYVLVVCSE